MPNWGFFIWPMALDSNLQWFLKKRHPSPQGSTFFFNLCSLVFYQQVGLCEHVRSPGAIASPLGSYFLRQACSSHFTGLKRHAGIFAVICSLFCISLYMHYSCSSSFFLQTLILELPKCMSRMLIPRGSFQSLLDS